MDEEPAYVATAARESGLGTLLARGEPRRSDRQLTTIGTGIIVVAVAVYSVVTWDFTAQKPFVAPLAVLLAFYGLMFLIRGWGGSPTYYLYSGGLVRASRAKALYIAWPEVRAVTTRSATRFTRIVTYRLEIRPEARHARRLAMSLSVLPGVIRDPAPFIDQFLRVLQENGL